MLQRIFILFTIFINISNSAFGQEFDVKESSRLTKFEGKPILVSLKVLRAVQKTNEYTTEQAAESLSIFEKISKNKNLSRTDKVVVDNMMAGFNIELGEDAKAITLLEEMLLKPRKPRKMELSGYNALAILYHNQGNFIKSIKNLNRWYIYEPTYFHQLEYMLSDNYLQLGDMENAYKTYLNAKKIYDGYITEGPDLGKDMKIFEYDELVENLNDIFSNGLPSEAIKATSNNIIPDPGDEFWMIEFAPKFPGIALRKGRTGSAKVKFDIKGNGRVDNLEVLEVSRSQFKRAANSHAKKMIYVRYAKTDAEYIARDVIYDLEFVFNKEE